MSPRLQVSLVELTAHEDESRLLDTIWPTAGGSHDTRFHEENRSQVVSTA